MRYSVWNHNKGSWDYYEAMGSLRAGVFAPNPRLPAGHRLGISPAKAARPLPANARYVGSGHRAEGLVASRKGLGFFDIDTSTLTRMAMFGAIGYVIWTMVLSPPQKAKVRRAVKGK